MAVVVLYGIRTCDTVKKARAWLASKGVRYEFHDYKAAGIDRPRLESWCRELGWEVLLNRASTTFRNLPEKEKAVRTEREAIALMVGHPSAIKRPVLDLGRLRVIGFKPELYQSLQWE